MVIPLPKRNIRVIVGPESGGVAREWSKVFVDFAVSKVLGKAPNTATINLYNLGQESLTWLESPGHMVQLLAGAEVPGMVFYGEINAKRGVETKRQGADIVTTIKAQDGKRVIQSGYFTGSYPPGVTRTQILTDALAAEGIASGYMHPLPERTYEAGASFSAPLHKVLDELYAGEIATWSVQNKVFQLVALGAPVAGTAPIISESTGMIGAPERTIKGVKVSTLLDGTLEPGGGFVVSAAKWSGSAKITKLDHRGDTDGRQWQTDLVGVPLGV